MTTTQVGTLVTALLNNNCSIRIENPNGGAGTWRVYARKLDGTEVPVGTIQTLATNNGVSASTDTADFF